MTNLPKKKFRPGTRRAIALIYTITPSILIAAPYWNGFLRVSFEIYIASVYVITIIGIIIFFKFNPCNFYAPVSGLLMSPLFPVILAIREYLNLLHRGGGYWAAIWQLNFLFAIAAAIFYVVPFVVIVVVVRMRRDGSGRR